MLLLLLLRMRMSFIAFVLALIPLVMIYAQAFVESTKNRLPTYSYE